MDIVVPQVHVELTSYCGVRGGAPGQPSHRKPTAVVANGAAQEPHLEFPTAGQKVAH